MKDCRFCEDNRFLRVVSGLFNDERFLLTSRSIPRKHEDGTPCYRTSEFNIKVLDADKE